MSPDGYVIVIYLVYSAVSVALIVWLARTLFRNGAVFLEDVFADKPALAESVNRLLVIGFYLINLGYAFLILRTGGAWDALSSMQVLIQRLGLLFASLGMIHLANMYVFYRIRRRAEMGPVPPRVTTPLAPQMTWNPPAGPPAS